MKPTRGQKMFLVGVFGEKARLFQWLVFASGSDPPTFTENRRSFVNSFGLKKAFSEREAPFSAQWDIFPKRGTFPNWKRQDDFFQNFKSFEKRFLGLMGIASGIF